MNQQRKLSKSHNGRQSSMGCETASVGSTKSGKSTGSSDHSPTIGQQQGANQKKANGLGKQGSQESNDSGNSSQPTNILNVAEMLLHGVADNEILDIWLKSIDCEEFVVKFIDAGYDMPTLSRITPQDLTAIGVTEPSKRLKILTEIKKLNLQDGIPNFRPTNLNHWLSLLRLDSYYYKSLCDQQIDTIEKLCQLMWEDFEELGITKLGHQKRFQLAIERVKELDTEIKCPLKTISEPIYDTNPSQILLVSSTENHSMNGPIINKQSSTSELSSTGSGSMHSVYSAASTHYQPAYAPIHDQQSTGLGVAPKLHQQNFNHQTIYSQIHSQAIYQQPTMITPPMQQQQQSHYQQPQQVQQIPLQPQTSPFINSRACDTNNIAEVGQSQVLRSSHYNRQSMGQLPLALANLPREQQQILQQSSIYATLGRSNTIKAKQPPPVPIRTNSLKSNSLMDDTSSTHSLQSQPAHNQTQINNGIMTTSSLFRSGSRVCNNNSRTQFNSLTLLNKNKSFSGNAHMEASRARFLNRQYAQQQQQLQHLPQLPKQIQNILNHNINTSNSNNTFNQSSLIYGIKADAGNISNSPHVINNGNLNLYRQIPSIVQYDKHQSSQQLSNHCDATSLYHHKGEDPDLQSDTNSTQSLVIQSTSSLSTTPVENHLSSSSTQESGSSQTLYNSVSSGSNDQDICCISQPGDLLCKSDTTTATIEVSSCTLNETNSVNKVSDSSNNINGNASCNATTGKDDNFPPPPSPLSLVDCGDSDLVPLNPALDSNFNAVNHGLMTFRVGI